MWHLRQNLCELILTLRNVTLTIHHVGLLWNIKHTGVHTEIQSKNTKKCDTLLLWAPHYIQVVVGFEPHSANMSSFQPQDMLGYLLDINGSQWRNLANLWSFTNPKSFASWLRANRPFPRKVSPFWNSYPKNIVLFEEIEGPLWYIVYIIYLLVVQRGNPLFIHQPVAKGPLCPLILTYPNHS